MLLFQEVVFSSNQLATLHGMEHLKMVRTLVLDGNQLESLPKEMGSLSELRLLSLKNNSIFMLILLVACPRQELSINAILAVLGHATGSWILLDVCLLLSNTAIGILHTGDSCYLLCCCLLS